jgi:hypothetical protein
MRPLAIPAVLLLLITGCATTPTTPPALGDNGKLPAAPADPVADGRISRGNLEEKSVAGPAAGQETVRRLQAGDPLLSVAAKSRFATDADYTASLTGTVILQSTAVLRSSASFAIYRVGAIEIHALPDGRVRVWAEFTNESKDSRTPMVCCRFNDYDERVAPVWRALPVTASKQRRLVSFESKDSNVSRVTVLVK